MKNTLILILVIMAFVLACGRQIPVPESGIYSGEVAVFSTPRFDNDSMLAVCAAMPCPASPGYAEFTVTNGIPWCTYGYHYNVLNWCYYTDAVSYTPISSYNVTGINPMPMPYCPEGDHMIRFPNDTVSLINPNKSGSIIYRMHWRRYLDGNPCGYGGYQDFKVKVVNYML